MYPSHEVTFISALMNSSVLYVKRSTLLQCSYVAIAIKKEQKQVSINISKQNLADV